ncbi:MlaE family lipid ABC transporter permease subunit [Accumulibacter sp.]|uniref:ABC transporter permease n=1 Tax=Accumulibacter sp. TaxID=2053492 RepID=UPI002608B1D5|nr:MlaE family lipid ABC transporter permease subunit [Accumulibacter sp.]
MNPLPVVPAAITQSTPEALALSGAWTARGLGAIGRQLDTLAVPARSAIVIDGSRIAALDTAGAWVLQKLLQRLRGEAGVVQVRELRPEFARLLEVVDPQTMDQTAPPARAPASTLDQVGRSAVAAGAQAIALLGFVGEIAVAFAGCVARPARFRWRPILYNLRSAGFDALPIVGLLSFLLGIVVAYQGADQLRQYGANIFIADLVGLSMLREFAPLITAIIIAGRSGSAYAAQIGTMSVTEEIDALRTLGIAPLDLLVLPKVLALSIALPLLTVFADVLGVFGGMLMARAQLGVGFGEFLDRFVKAVSVTAYLVGICKAPAFAIIIAVIGCFQGFRTRGGADSVGRQTTRSVVQSIFLVIVADALFSVAFSALDL